MQHPELADTFEAVADHGHDGYYTGRIAEGKAIDLKVGCVVLISLTAIVELIQSRGGVMTTDDLKTCEAEVIQPVKYDYRAGKSGKEGVTLWEVSPILEGDGQGSSDTVSSERSRVDSTGCSRHS